MSSFFINEILEKDGPVIMYSDFTQPIIQALRSMELDKIPLLTRFPFLLGKSLVLMSLVLDGLESRRSVFVIAATNRPELIDPAMMRP